jgi:hypothetical protein
MCTYGLRREMQLHKYNVGLYIDCLLIEQSRRIYSFAFS